MSILFLIALSTAQDSGTGLRDLKSEQAVMTQYSQDFTKKSNGKVTEKWHERGIKVDLKLPYEITETELEFALHRTGDGARNYYRSGRIETAPGTNHYTAYVPVSEYLPTGEYGVHGFDLGKRFQRFEGSKDFVFDNVRKLPKSSELKIVSARLSNSQIPAEGGSTILTVVVESPVPLSMLFGYLCLGGQGDIYRSYHAAYPFSLQPGLYTLSVPIKLNADDPNTVYTVSAEVADSVGTLDQYDLGDQKPTLILDASEDPDSQAKPPAGKITLIKYSPSPATTDEKAKSVRSTPIEGGRNVPKDIPISNKAR